MTWYGSMGQGAMLAITIGVTLAFANGIWGAIAPTGRDLEQWTKDTIYGEKVWGMG